MPRGSGTWWAEDRPGGGRGAWKLLESRSKILRKNQRRPERATSGGKEGGGRDKHGG